MTAPAKLFPHGSVTGASFDCFSPRFAPQLSSARDARSCTSLNVPVPVPALNAFRTAPALVSALTAPARESAAPGRFHFSLASAAGSALTVSACDARSFASRTVLAQGPVLPASLAPRAWPSSCPFWPSTRTALAALWCRTTRNLLRVHVSTFPHAPRLHPAPLSSIFAARNTFPKLWIATLVCLFSNTGSTPPSSRPETATYDPKPPLGTNRDITARGQIHGLIVAAT